MNGPWKADVILRAHAEAKARGKAKVGGTAKGTARTGGKVTAGGTAKGKAGARAGAGGGAGAGSGAGAGGGAGVVCYSVGVATYTLRWTGTCTRKMRDRMFRWVIYLISSAHLHVRPTGRTCRRADKIEVNPRCPQIERPTAGTCTGVQRNTETGKSKKKADRTVGQQPRRQFHLVAVASQHVPGSHTWDASYVQGSERTRSSGCQLISLSACQLVSLSACQLVGLSDCQLISLSACRIVNFPA